MKKMVSFVTILLLALLSACSSANDHTDAPKQSGEITKKQESIEVELDKAFNVKTSVIVEKTTELKMVVTNFEIVQDLSQKAEDNAKYDYVKFDISFENIGDKESHSQAVSNYSFKFYDENGVEIEADNYLAETELEMDGTLKKAAVRPGGKNQGKLIFPIPKGSKPGEMVYSSQWGAIYGTNEYIFSIKH